MVRIGTTSWNRTASNDPGSCSWAGSYTNMGFLAVGGNNQPMLAGTPWVKLKGSFEADYLWDSSALPPTRQYFRRTTTAEGYWQNRGWAGSFGSVELKTGTDYKEEDATLSDPFVGDFFGRKRRSVAYGEFDGSSMAYTAKLPVGEAAANSPVWDQPVRAMVSGLFEFLPNPRIYLGSKNDDQANYRNVNGQRVYNQPDRNLDREVDIAARWADNSPVYAGWSGDLFLDAGYGLIANKKYQWFYDGPADPFNATSEVFRYSHGLGNGSGPTLGGTSQIIVNIEDADWAAPHTLKSNLLIRWHFPYENWTYVPNTLKEEWIVPPDFKADVSPVSANSNVRCTWTDGHDYYKGSSLWNDNQGWVKVAEAVAGHYLGPVRSLLEAAEIAVNFVPKPHAEISNGDQAWTNPRSTPPLAQRTGARGLYRVAYSAEEKYILKDWRGEAYGGQGYEGMVVKATKKRNGFELMWRGDYTRDEWGEGGGTPGPGGGENPPSNPGGGGTTPSPGGVG